MNGSTVTIDRLQRVREIHLGDVEYADGLRYKTVDICSLSRLSWRKVVRRLEQFVAAGRVNEFYERVFAEMVADGSLSFLAVFFDPDTWHEIDTLADLEKAERPDSDSRWQQTSPEQLKQSLR